LCTDLVHRGASWRYSAHKIAKDPRRSACRAARLRGNLALAF
jgi:hypothetical protein